MSWLHDKADEGAMYGKLLSTLVKVCKYLSLQASLHPEDLSISELFLEVQNYIRRPL